MPTRDTAEINPTPENRAARILTRGGQLQVEDAPYTPPGDDQIVIRVRALAINPVDWLVQVAGNFVYRWLTYPAVLGSDVAGDVVEVGKNVTRFMVGDRVLGHAVGTDKDSNRQAEGAFQRYSVVLERMACPVPNSMAFEEAAVLPLAVSTAACGLFQDDQLGLARPIRGATPTGQTLLVWGGSTSVGSQAIQLAVAAGYEVITTASPRNFDYVRSLGASLAFDYHIPTVIPDIIKAFQGRTSAGAIAFGSTSAAACVRIVARSSGKKFVALASPPVSLDGVAPDNPMRFGTPRTIGALIRGNVALQVRARTSGVGTKFIYGTTLKSNTVSQTIYRDFLPTALAEGRYQAAPQPHIVGEGLDQIQPALNAQRRGVSASKIVVKLD